MAKFKIGDRVRATIPVGSAMKNRVVGTVISNGSAPSVEFDEDIDGHSDGGRGKNRHCWVVYESEIELITESETNKTLMSSISSFVKKITRSEPEKTFVQVGFLDENENITPKGEEALQYVVWEANKVALKTLADQMIAEEGASKK